MSQRMKALVIAAALCGATPPALSQDGGTVAATTNEEAAEEAFLKAYFQEKELRDVPKAEKAYADLIAAGTASHEVLGRALLGRARCLRVLKRGDEADVLFARVEKEFADIADAAKEAAAARKSPAREGGGELKESVLAALSDPAWDEETPRFGDRAVPVLRELLRDVSPETVSRAACVLASIDTPAAVEALASAIETGDSAYPAQVRRGAFRGTTGMETLARLGKGSDAEARRRALATLLMHRKTPDWAIGPALADIELCRSEFGPGTLEYSADYVRVLLTAIANGPGEPRDLAIARIREFSSSSQGWANLGDILGNALIDAPDAVLRDPGALAAIVQTLSSQASSSRLVNACLAFPETEAAGVRLSLETWTIATDLDRFVTALARSPLAKDRGFLENHVRAIVQSFGSPASPARVRQVATVWPTAAGSVKALIRAMVDAGVRSDEAWTALHDGLQTPAARETLVRTLAEDMEPAAVGPWAVRSFARELDHPNWRVRAQAAAAMERWHDALGVDLSPYVDAVVAGLGDTSGFDAAARRVLESVGAPAKASLRRALREHAKKRAIVVELGALHDAEAAQDIEQILRTSDDPDDVGAAATALATLRGDAAKDALAAAIVNHDCSNADTVVSRLNLQELRPETQFELVKLALAKAPDVIEDAYVGAFTMEMVRELAIAALRSSSAKARRWGAGLEQDLLDAGAWDALLAAAEDADASVRDSARDALRAIRARETEMAAFRAMGEERATRKRIESLVASKDARQRRAGVAAIAATGLAGMVNDLIRLAAEDDDGDVADDARKALLAMAKPAPSSQPSPAPADKK